jgi:3-oxoacyl-[acyl-carrier protein] reductase
MAAAFAAISRSTSTDVLLTLLKISTLVELGNAASPIPTRPRVRGVLPLSGRVAIVTGANHGIGAAIARGLAARGADVLVTYLRFTPDLSRSNLSREYHDARARDGSAVVAAIAALGRRAVAVEADLTAPDAAPSLFERAEHDLGPVSMLVHNASGWKRDSFGGGRVDHVGQAGFAVNAESIDAQMLVDARAGALLMQELVDRHRARRATWGRIVTMTSGTGGAFPGQVSYGAAKSALISYTLSAASEMARDGICANVVYPPVTDTGWITDDVRQFVERDDEHHHIATPDEVAETVVWLCADANHLVTGNIIRLR